MNKILGYIGNVPFNNLLSTNLQYNNIHTIINNKITTTNTNDLYQYGEIFTALTKQDNTQTANNNFIVCTLDAQTNIDNINLPFNTVKKPKTIDEIMLYTLEYLTQNSKSEVIKALDYTLIGDLTIVYYDKKKDAIFCRMGANPLIIGVGEKFNIIANDITQISTITNKLIPLESGEKAKITRDKITIYNSKNRRIKKNITKLNTIYTPDNDFYLNEELFTLSSVINSLITSTIKNGKPHYDKLKINKLNAKTFTQIVIVSDIECINATLSAKKALNVICDIPIDVYLSCEYVRECKTFDSSTLFIAVSLKGESVTLASCVDFAKKLKVKTIALTSNKLSYISRLCDYTILTPPISEDCVYGISLDTFPIVYLSLVFFGIFIGYTLGSVSDLYVDVAIKMVQTLSGKIAQSTKHIQMFDELEKIIKNSNDLIFTACGIDYPLICEISSLFSATSTTPNKAISTFKLNKNNIHKSTTIISVITNKDYLHEFKEKIKLASKIGANTIIITNCNISDSFNDFKNVLCLPESLPIYNILPPLASLYYLIIYCNENNSLNNSNALVG